MQLSLEFNKQHSALKAPLSVYRSSAGSGKTFIIAKEYLKIALRHPSSFKRILAITFTNKATHEMKSRIILFLEQLASDQNLPFRDELKQTLQIDEAQLKSRATNVLNNILYDYGDFNITTIDGFFHRIVRSFAYELGINSQHRIELDTNLLLDETVDRTLSLAANDPELREWVLEFTFNELNEERRWDITMAIRNFSGALLKEDFKKIAPKIMKTGKERVRDLKDNTQKELKEVQSYIKNQGKEFIRITSQANLTDQDFKKGIFSFFQKLSHGNFEDLKPTLQKCAHDPLYWASKKAKGNVNLEELASHFMSFLQGYPQLLSKYHFLAATLENIFSLGLMVNLQNQFHELKTEERIMLINDITYFLYEITADIDAPFIYEKTGNRFQNFFIDEFQDTSSFQWANMKPLLDNSLAANHQCLIVGDSKQSIYRWRGGESQLLSHQIDKDFRKEQVAFKNLNTNWRSAKKVIDFNNNFFSFLQNGIFDDSASNELKLIFKDLIQKKAHDQIPEGKVKIEFTKEKEVEASLHLLKNQIEEIQAAGYRLRDIGILVRKNADGKKNIDYLNDQPTGQYTYKTISSESLFLDSSTAVNIIIDAIRFINEPSNPIYRKNLVYDYFIIIKKEKISLHGLFCEENKLVDEYLEQFASFKIMQLEHIVNHLIKILEIESLADESAYIAHFIDAIGEFSQKQADLSTFLLWWENTGHKKSLQTPDQIDAATVITIHKAKGLQYKFVLIPFANWALDHEPIKKQTMWIEDPPLDDIHVIPINYKRSLMGTPYELWYQEEKNRILIDNINLSYVAFTRAELYLWMAAPHKKNIQNISKISCLLQHWAISQGMENGSFETGYYTEIGNIESGTKEESETFYFPEKTAQQIKVKRKNYLTGSVKEKYSPIHMGSIMHQMLSTMKNYHEIDQKVDAYCLLHDLDVSIKKFIKHRLEEIMTLKQVKSWFMEGLDVRTEVPVLPKNGNLKRFDRVIFYENKTELIDYKTGKQRKEDITQVSEYKNILKEMYDGEVKAWLLYLGDLKIIEV